MKKKKVIRTIFIIFLFCIMIFNREWIDYQYFYHMDTLFLSTPLDRSIYSIIIVSSDDVIFKDKKNSILLPNQIEEHEMYSYDRIYDYYCVVSNCLVEYYEDRNFKNGGVGWLNNYHIRMQDGSGFSAVSKENFKLQLHAWFYNEDEVCRELQLNIYECKEFRCEVQKDNIRCYTDSSFGVDTMITINLNYQEYFTEIWFRNLDFEIKSFEIRKNADGKPMVYLDMDGDGMYEKDCSEYLYEIPIG